MTALVFGDENSANPAPVTISAEIITGRPVSSAIKVRMHVPAAHNAMPADDMTYGDNLSENFPATGVSAAITTGSVSYTHLRAHET